jgi:hypothetical protein
MPQPASCTGSKQNLTSGLPNPALAFSTLPAALGPQLFDPHGLGREGETS